MAGKPGCYVNRAEISEATQVPHDYLLKVLHQLDEAGLVYSRRGPTGGYQLRKPADKMSVLEVVLAVDKITRITECPLGIEEHKQLCPLHQLLDDAGRLVEEAFVKTRIIDLIPRKRSRKCEFPIKNPKG